MTEKVNNVEKNTVRNASREKTGALVGLIGLILNVLLGAGKLAVGLLSGSVAIISDAANNLSDAGNSVVTVSSFVLGGRKADKGHPYGHGRYEYIASLVIGVIILIVGFQFAISAVQKIVSPSKVVLGGLMIGVMGASIAVKAFMAVFYRIKAAAINSDTLRAASADSFFDCLVTGGVLIGLALTLILPLWVDGLVALLVSLVIIFGGIKILASTINRLLGKSDPETARSIKNILQSEPMVVGTHDLRVHDYGPSTILASVHAEFDRELSIMEAHNVIDALEHKVFNELGVELVVHCDPIDSSDLVLNRVRHTIKDIIRTYRNSSIHDLDLDYALKVVAFHLKMDERTLIRQKAYIMEQLTEAIGDILPEFRIEVEFDIVYS